MSTSRKALFTLAAFGLAAFAVHPASAQTTITNGNFGANSFAVYPGYVNKAGNGASNGTITGWTSNNNNSGLNLTTGPNSDGVHPFADNGYIPGENQVAFLQSDNNLTTTLSQTLSGFKSGDQYKVSFFDNSRTYSQDPILSVLLGGKSIFTSTITPVESKGSYNVEYHTDSGIYTAGSSSTADLLFSSASTKDATVLIGGITIQDLGPVSAAPEPSQMGMLALVAAGLGALVVKARKRKTATLAA